MTATLHMHRRRLSLEVTNACNFNCLHCFNRPASQGDLASLDLDSASRLVQEAYELGCRDVLLTGGEPVLWPPFGAFYERVCSYGDISVKLNTNASLVDREIVELFAAHPPANIHIGLYGWDETSYAEVTGNEQAYACVSNGVKLLAEAGLRFYLLIPGIRSLAENQERVDAFAKKLGPESIVRDWILGDDVHRNAARNAQIRRVRLSPREAAKGMIRDKGGVDKIMDALLSPSPRDYECLFSCLRNYRQVVVDPHLNLLPCIILRHPRYIFNLEHASLRDGLAFVEQVARVPHERTEERDRCGQCAIRGICRNCPANAFLEHGDYEGIGDYYCQVSREIADILGLPM